jgi:hypothetical protein
MKRMETGVKIMTTLVDLSRYTQQLMVQIARWISMICFGFHCNDGTQANLLRLPAFTSAFIGCMMIVLYTHMYMIRLYEIGTHEMYKICAECGNGSVTGIMIE